MARTQTIVQMNDELLALLDREAARRGMSRSALIRDAVAAYLADAAEAEVTRQIVEGYRRVPPGLPDGWGDLESLADHSTLETMQRLDAEERAAGHDSW